MTHAATLDTPIHTIAAQTASPSLADGDVPFVRRLDDSRNRLHLMVDNVHCAGCIRKIEGALSALDGVGYVRLNLSTRRLVVDWDPAMATASRVMRVVEDLGFPAAPFDPETFGARDAAAERQLLTALAVAGFAAGNVMLLSVSVWAGHDGSMGAATRELFHWISALIALPAIAYAGRPFFGSAAAALSGRHLNMDVPISLAVILAAGMSLYQTAAGGEHAYFDAAVGLLFFLLIGRYLDQRARSKARSAAQHLVRMTATGATIRGADGEIRKISINDLAPGQVMLVAAGERLAGDGTVVSGRSSADASLVTGESLPNDLAPGDPVFAGTINLAAPLEVVVTAAGDDTLLAEIVRLMEAAEQSRARYVRVADRVARIYAPAVHLLAAGTFLGWMIAGSGWEASLMTAIAVLIITCPCALGLAVPTVQVVASGWLLKHGILLKSPDGLERLAEIDVAVFDKTGTLTEGRPALANASEIADDDRRLAGALARLSSHPLCAAIAEASPESGAIAKDVTETPGCGIAGLVDGEALRLGNAAWIGVAPAQLDPARIGSEIWLRRGAAAPIRFAFEDKSRQDVAAAIDQIKRLGIDVRILSGDRQAVVDGVARGLGVDDAAGGCMPADKVAAVQALAADGRRVLMIGDGINDAPALAEGHASMSPASAADISRTAADIVFQGGSPMAVANAIRVARLANRLVHQNFALAFLYNAVAVPLAIAGFATPLFAAAAMSGSSLVVTLNSLRMRLLAWRAAS